LWNYEEVLSILEKYTDVVKVYFSGHFHVGFETIHKGIHMYTVKSILESPEDSNSFGIVNVMENSIQIKGFGITKDTIMKW